MSVSLLDVLVRPAFVFVCEVNAVVSHLDVFGRGKNVVVTCLVVPVSELVVLVSEPDVSVRHLDGVGVPAGYVEVAAEVVELPVEHVNVTAEVVGAAA